MSLRGILQLTVPMIAQLFRHVSNNGLLQTVESIGRGKVEK